MKALWSVLPFRWKAGIVGIFLAVLVSVYLLWAHSLYQDGYDASTEKGRKAAISIREKQNEIRNNRPDLLGSARSMRARTF